MKQLYKIILPLFAVLIMLSGCSGSVNYDLPPNPEGFETYEYQGFMAVDYNGRTYVPYGTLKGKIYGRNIDRCVGYIIQDGEEMKDTRLYILEDDDNVDYLMEYCVDGEMEQPMFLRAVDTVGCDVAELEYIESLEYDFWEQYEF